MAISIAAVSGGPRQACPPVLAICDPRLPGREDEQGTGQTDDEADYPGRGNPTFMAGAQGDDQGP
jgi:hypothetical protein